MQKGDRQALLGMYQSMLRARKMEEAVIGLYESKEIVSDPHLGIGQEAVSVGVIANLRPSDRVVGTYRGHIHALMKGVPMESIFGEIMGKASGTGRGYGGPMHLADQRAGLAGNFSIVGAGIPIAAGLGMASKLLGHREVSVCFFGDGATNTGYFHEGLNMASVYETPTVFVIENNQYSEHTPIGRIAKVKDLSERSRSYGMRGVTCDGNDVEAVHSAAKEAVDAARSSWEPTLLEFRTYRKTGHSAKDDETLEHPEAERKEWFARDPIALCRARLLADSVLTETVEGEMLRTIDAEVAAALQKAREAPWPSPEGMEGSVFGGGPREMVSPATQEVMNPTMRSAINIAMAQSMRRDPSIVLFGEDVAKWGGVYRASIGLLDEFGPERVWDTPISEASMVGMGVGLSLGGLRPIVEIMFADLLLVALDAIGNSAAKKRWMSGGTEDLPLVIRTACGGRIGLPATHTETLEGLFLALPGVKIVTPSNAYDAKGLLCEALRGPDPVIFFEHKMLYPKSGVVPDDYYTLPLGKAKVAREGTDVTLVSNMYMLQISLQAADALSKHGISAEVVDLTSIVPLDSGTILSSVEKTGALVTVEEAPVSGGWSNLVAATVAEKGFASLKHPIARIALPDTPVPYSPPLVRSVVPTPETIATRVRTLLGR